MSARLPQYDGLTLDNATVRFITEAPKIEPMELTRSSDGYCSHPAVPWEQLDEYPVAPFFRAWGYDFYWLHMSDEHDEEHPLLVSYFDGGSIREWEPTPPKGDGWILISIGDGEDGPDAWWVRKAVKR